MSEEWPYDEWNWSQLREEISRLSAENERLSASLETARKALLACDLSLGTVMDGSGLARLRALVAKALL